MTDNDREPLHLWADGHPAPQGSKKTFRTKSGRVNVVESSKRVPPWRRAVADAARDAIAELGDDWPGPMQGPVAVYIGFAMPRPKHHYGTGRNADKLKPDAPLWANSRTGDIDKLERSTLDALTTARVIVDDAQVVAVEKVKQYANGRPGARITVRPIYDRRPQP